MDVLFSESIPWISCLLSALRTGAACVLVMLGICKASEFVEFPVFGYVVTILVLSQSTLGKALEDGCYAVYGTLQAVAMCMFVLQIIGNENIGLGMCLACIFVKSFIISYIPSQPAVKKRLALAVTTIIYVNVYINSSRTHPVFFPLKLAFTVILGTTSAIIVLIFPIPRLASYQIQYTSKMCAKMAMDQFKSLIEAFYSKELKHCLKSNTLEQSGLLLELHKRKEEAKWEPNILTQECRENFTERLDRMNSCLVGMRMAIFEEMHHLPSSKWGDVEVVKSNLEQLTEDLILTKSKTPKQEEVLLNLNNLCSNHVSNLSLPVMYFMFVMRIFLGILKEDGISVQSPPSIIQEKVSRNLYQVMKSSLRIQVKKSQAIEAFKIGLSLTLAVYLGILYSKPYGYWSTITVTLGLFNHSSGTFSTTSLRLQGTVLGTIYGYLVALVTHQDVLQTILALAPWFLFTSYMRTSKLLKPTGSSSTLVSAIIILGRKRPGAVQDFAILRITQALLGLGVYLAIEAVIRPRQAPALARNRIVKNILGITDLVGKSCGSVASRSLAAVNDGRQSVVEGVTSLRALVYEAERDYSGFSGDCYRRMADVQYQIAELLHFLGLGLVEISEANQAKTGVYDLVKLVETHVIASLGRCLACISAEHPRCGDTDTDTDVEKQQTGIGTELVGLARRIDHGFNELLVVVEEAAGQAVGAIGFCCSTILKRTVEMEELAHELYEGA